MIKVILAEPIGDRFNLDGAKAHGEIGYVSEQINPFACETAITKIKNGLKRLEYDPEIDYLCLTGQVLTVAMFLAVAVQEYGEVTVLAFHAKDGYKTRVFNVADITTQD